MKQNMTKFQKIGFFIGMALICCTLSVAPLVSMAYADNHKGGFTGPSGKTGGFTGPGPAVIGIKDAGNQPDDAWVTLQGKILNNLGDDKYTFQDASGSGVVEIERKAWHGVSVGPNDKVSLLVKVDKDWGSVELEVKTVQRMGN